MVFFDCCHSGTLADLPHIYRTSLENRGTISALNADVTMISGCRDEQTSADAYIDRRWAGAMTYHAIKVLKGHDYSIKIKDLIDELRKELKDGNYTQYPVLSASNPIVLERFFCMKDAIAPIIT
jgi:aminopeptidase-like protein